LSKEARLKTEGRGKIELRMKKIDEEFNEIKRSSRYKK
jgi:hypothetical protein